MTELTVRDYDVQKISQQFPLLQQEINGYPLIYLDSAATTQKPQRVIDAVSKFYECDNANVHRGIYSLSERATAHYEAARQEVKNFINAARNHEVIFTRSATEAMNLVAHSFGALSVSAGDEIILTQMEHHSNIVPWQMLAERVGAVIKVVPMREDGALDLVALQALLTEKTKIVCCIHVSNVLGIRNPIKEIVKIAHSQSVPVLVDGTQAVPHEAVDVQDLDCDFYVFSGHKMYAPTGVGVLYGKEQWLDRMPPYQGGGDMILTVSFEHTDYNVLPHKFEAGTPNSAGVIGLHEAIQFLRAVDMEQLQQHEAELMRYTRSQLAGVAGVRMLHASDDNAGVISFVMDNAHPHDIATILDQRGVAIRAGHHCAMPLMTHLGVAATARISFAAYTTKADIDACIASLHSVNEIFQVA